MVGSLFEECLVWFDHEVYQRYLLLFMDNASVHTVAVTEVASQLKHTTVVYFSRQHYISFAIPGCWIDSNGTVGLHI